ncbi:IPT/TIG domain protein [compost metagenome]
MGTPVCRDVLARGRHALGLLSVLLALVLSALPSGVRAQALWFETNIPPAMRGVPYDVQLTPKWGTGTGYVFSATFLPPGINLSPSGRLTGTVTSLQGYIFDVTLTDSSAATQTQNVSFNVTEPLAIRSDIPDGQVGTPFSWSSQPSGGTRFDASYAYDVTISPALPNGLTVSNDGNGVISGMPLVAGSYSGTITVRDKSDYTTSQPLSFTIAPTAPTVTSVSPAAGPSTGGANVIIKGTNFTGATVVTFGATASSFVVDSATQITATSPAGGPGTVDITVTTPGGTSATSGADQYTYEPAPTVTAVSPGSGPSSGGTTVIIMGMNFAGGAAVTFEGALATDVTVNSTTQITATTPAGTGMVDVRVTTAGGTSTTSPAARFSYLTAPTVTSISPNSGPSTGGTSVTITGTNFTGTTAVTFGGAPATGVTVNSATQITATTPAGTGTVDVRVTTAGGTSTTSAAGQFTYVAAPTVTSISPNSGPSAGGTSVTIGGTNFSGATKVTFGGAAAASFTFDSTTQIRATPPAGTGTVDVRVTTVGGTSAVSAAGQFTYEPAPTVTAVSPGSGPTSGGTTVTISGTNLAGATTVTFGGMTASHTVNSATSITATAPAGTGAVDVRVTTAGGTSTTSAFSQFTYVGAPTVTSIAPTKGPITGGTTVSITGTNFTGVTGVTFGGTGATSFRFDNATQITATAPAGTGTVDVRVTTAGGTSATSAADQFTYVAAPTAGSLTLNVVFNTAKTFDLSGQVSGDYTSMSLVAAPLKGTVVLNANGSGVYTPNLGYYGPDSFMYQATGPGGVSAFGTVTLSVAAPVPTIEQPSGPVVVPPSAGGSGSVSIDLGAISQGPIDGYRITNASRFGVAEIVDGAAAAPLQAGGSAAPKAAGPYRLVYTPAANFMGEDTVILVAQGVGGESAPVTFTFQVAGKAPDLSGTVLAGASVAFTPTATLIGGPFQALRITRAPDFGTATVNGLSIVFTPGANGGATSLDYVVDLAFGPSAPGRVSLTANALPGSEALTAQTLQGVPVTVRISNAEGGPFTGAAVVSVAPTTAGEATIAKVGADYDLTFVSTGDFSGETVVTYSLSNAFGTTDSTLTVTVEARPDPSLDPEVRGVATSQVTSARRFADAQINNFQQRLRDLHDGTNGSSNGLSLNLGLGGADEDRDPQQALRRQLGQDRGLDPGALGGDRDREMLGLNLWAGRAQAASTVGASDDRLNAAAAQPATGGGASVGLWTSGSVDWGRQDATGQRDSRFTTQGATLGLDVKVSDQLIVGGGVGYGEDKTRIGDNGSVTNGKAFTGAFYASWRPAEAFYVDGVLGYANLDFTSRRWVEGLAGQADGYADGDRSGDVRFASAAFGRVLRGERVTSDFYARLDARDITLDGFTETGGGLSALNWDEIEQKSLSANLGASWRWTLDSRRYGQFRPTARVEWSHELEDIGAQGVRYADWITSPTYLVPLNAWSRNAINLDLGTEWSLSDRLMLSLGYRGALGDASASHGAQIGMKYGW